jgi:hypothetical protein
MERNVWRLVVQERPASVGRQCGTFYFIFMYEYEV